jgi:hypothetical protein
MDHVPSILLSSAVDHPWVGVLCVLFFLCGGTIAWIFGYQAGRMDGRAAARKELSGDDQSQVLG